MKTRQSKRQQAEQEARRPSARGESEAQPERPRVTRALTQRQLMLQIEAEEHEAVAAAAVAENVEEAPVLPVAAKKHSPKAKPVRHKPESKAKATAAHHKKRPICGDLEDGWSREKLLTEFKKIKGELELLRRGAHGGAAPSSTTSAQAFKMPPIPPSFYHSLAGKRKERSGEVELRLEPARKRALKRLSDQVKKHRDSLLAVATSVDGSPPRHLPLVELLTGEESYGIASAVVTSFLGPRDLCVLERTCKALGAADCLGRLSSLALDVNRVGAEGFEQLRRFLRELASRPRPQLMRTMTLKNACSFNLGARYFRFLSSRCMNSMSKLTLANCDLSHFTEHDNILKAVSKALSQSSLQFLRLEEVKGLRHILPKSHSDLLELEIVVPYGRFADICQVMTASSYTSLRVLKLRVGLGGHTTSAQRRAFAESVITATPALQVLEYSDDGKLFLVELFEALVHFKKANEPGWDSLRTCDVVGKLRILHRPDSVDIASVLDAIEIGALPQLERLSLPIWNDRVIDLFRTGHLSCLRHLETELPKDKARFRELVDVWCVSPCSPKLLSLSLGRTPMTTENLGVLATALIQRSLFPNLSSFAMSGYTASSVEGYPSIGLDQAFEVGWGSGIECLKVRFGGFLSETELSRRFFNAMKAGCLPLLRTLKALRGALTSSYMHLLTDLRLSSVSLGDTMFTELCRAAVEDGALPQLISIDVANNKLTEASVTALIEHATAGQASGRPLWRFLWRLDLSGNSLTDAAVVALYKALIRQGILPDLRRLVTPKVRRPDELMSLSAERKAVRPLINSHLDSESEED